MNKLNIMLDITFYTEAGEPTTVDFSIATYELLTKFGFIKNYSEEYQDTIIVLDHEEVIEIDAVDLFMKREEYSDSIRKAIVYLCFSILMELKDVELETIFESMKKLKELLLQVENKNNRFMEF